MSQPTSTRNDNSNRKWKYILKGTIWYLCSMIIGNSQLLIFWGISNETDGAVGTHIIENLLYREGIVMFSSGLLMWAVLLEILLSRHKLEQYEGLIFYAPPFVFLLIIIIQYLFLHDQIAPVKLFDVRSFATWSKLVLSAVYCVYGKTYLYLKDERKRRRRK